MGVHFARVWNSIVGDRPVKTVISPRKVDKASASRYGSGIECPKSDKLRMLCREFPAYAPAILDSWARDKAVEQWEIAREIALDGKIDVQLEPDFPVFAPSAAFAQVEKLLVGLLEDQREKAVKALESMHAAGLLGTVAARPDSPPGGESLTG